MIKFGNTIKRYRIKNKLTVSKVAEELNLSSTEYLNWENDLVDIELDDIKRLVEIFDTTIEEFYDNLDTKEKRLKSFLYGFISGILIFLVLYLIYPLITSIHRNSKYTLFSVLLSIYTMMIITQMRYKSMLSLMFGVFLSRSIDIFLFIRDIKADGPIGLIIMLFTFGLALLIVSLLFFIVGLVIILLLNPFTYIYEIFKIVK